MLRCRGRQWCVAGRLRVWSVSVPWVRPLEGLTRHVCSVWSLSVRGRPRPLGIAHTALAGVAVPRWVQSGKGSGQTDAWQLPRLTALKSRARRLCYPTGLGWCMGDWGGTRTNPPFGATHLWSGSRGTCGVLLVGYGSWSVSVPWVCRSVDARAYRVLCFVYRSPGGVLFHYRRYLAQRGHP